MPKASRSSSSANVTYLDAEATRREVERAVAALARSRPEIRRVLLFGSLATGRAAPGSDADLLLILDHSDRQFRDRIPEYIPEGCHIGVDVFPYTPAELEAMKAEGNWLLTRALTEGIEIYNRDKQAGATP